MAKRGGAMHVATSRSHHGEKAYATQLLRRSYREDGKVKKETLANLSHLPPEIIDLIRKSLAGETFVSTQTDFEVKRSLFHGDSAAVWQMAKKLGLPELVGPSSRERDLIMTLIVARVLRPSSKLSTLSFLKDMTLAHDLGCHDASTDDVYRAMDWLATRKTSIEKKLISRHIGESDFLYFDLSSSWVEGEKCPLAAYGYSRDGKRGKKQIEYGLLTDNEGRPLASEVFPGNYSDPTTFVKICEKIKDDFSLSDVVLVGDRGMITSARIEKLKEQSNFGWISALRSNQIAQLVDSGALQLSLFDEANLAEISHTDFPDERLVVCKNPHMATLRAKKREDLLIATEAVLEKIKTSVESGRLKTAKDIALRVGSKISRYKMKKHFDLSISDGYFSYSRKLDEIEKEASLDGIYIVRTSVPKERLTSGQVVQSYKNLAKVESAFRSLKSIDLDLRPIYHYKESRVQTHVFICTMAAYLLWHLRQAWAPLTFTDEDPPIHDNPVAKKKRSTAADKKASTKKARSNTPAHSFRSLLSHLSTLTRDLVAFGNSEHLIEKITTPTDQQRQAFELIGADIPLKLTYKKTK